MPAARPCPGIVVAAPASGAGKTTIALALMAAARRRGLAVQPFKVGPDFIDPGHHTRIAGRPARTLDGWMLGRDGCVESFARGTADAELAVVEGMMGLFDGVAADSDAGSTAEVARWLDLPVVLVVDAGAMARSVAALVRGFRDFDPAVRVVGVVFNRIGGEGHRRLLEAALASSAAPPCLGALPRDAALAIPERHLGLVTAEEQALPSQELAAAAERFLDVERILALAGGDVRPPAVDDARPEHDRTAGRGTGTAGARPIIAVARDAAFSFYYVENLERLRAAGATLIACSPLADARLPDGASGLYLGGGYPELHGARLAANGSFLADVRALAARGGVIYGECGGLMYLGRALHDLEGRSHTLAGVLPLETRMLARGLTLGYREVAMRADGLLPALRARGHEFHHSTLDEASVAGDLERVYEVRDPVSGAVTREGFRCDRTLASYVHVHFASAPGFAEALVAAAREAA